MAYVKFDRVLLKNHPQFTDRWVQDRIAEDPALLGLGDVILKDKERIQPRAGRLDLLCRERTQIDVTRSRSSSDQPTSRTSSARSSTGILNGSGIHSTNIRLSSLPRTSPRGFLNVISLFNGQIPLIAMQMSAFQIGDSIGLVFTKVVDQLNLGLIDEDEDTHEVTDRSYWEARGSHKTVAMADTMLELVRKLDPRFELKYNKFYIGLAKNGEPNNFMIFRPAKTFFRLSQDLSVQTLRSNNWRQRAWTLWITTNAGDVIGSDWFRKTCRSMAL
jgi:hypothetical protein